MRGRCLMVKYPEYTNAQVIAALESSAGIVSAAAMKLGCSGQTVRNYMAREAEIREARDNIREENLDLAETKLLMGIKSGNMTSVIFFLKTQGKARGYIEGREIQGPGGGPIQTENREVSAFEQIQSRLDGLTSYRGEDEDTIGAD